MDLDGDGLTDILSGSYTRLVKDMAGLFQVLRGRADGTFSPAEALKGTDGEPLVIPADNEKNAAGKICTRPFGVDWDADGRLDLVVGNLAGTFYLFKGRGKGQFDPKPEQLQAGGAPLRIKGQHSDPFVVDWDGDGDLDVVSGSTEGGVQWAENAAGRGKTPELKPFRPLIAPGPQADSDGLLAEADLTGPGRATRVWAADVDGDGKLDLLVGDSVTLVAPAEGVGAEEFKEKLARWRADLKAAAEAVNKVLGDKARKDEKAVKKAREEYRDVFERKAEFMKEEMTGYVWLYRRK